MAPFAKLLLGLGAATGALVLLRSRSASSTTAPAGTVDARPPGEQIQPGDRFEADLSGRLPIGLVPDALRAPAQVFVATGILPPNGPRTAIQGRHEASELTAIVPTQFVTKKL